jgi:hypothetical protein
MSSTHDELPEELQGEQIVDLPSREALSIVDPGMLGIGLPLPLGRTPDPSPATPENAEPPAPTS